MSAISRFSKSYERFKALTRILLAFPKSRRLFLFTISFLFFRKRYSNEINGFFRRLFEFLGFSKIFWKASTNGFLTSGIVFQPTRHSKDDLLKELPSHPFSSKKEVDFVFWQRLKFLIRILIPSCRSKAFLLLVTHSAFLVFRSVLSVYIARLDGRITRDLVSGHGKAFIQGLCWWMATSIPATYTNSMLSYLQSSLAVIFRVQLTEFTHKQYLSNLVYYKLLHLDDRIKNADQCITQDITKFCQFLAEVYSNLAKPILDILILTWAFSRSAGIFSTFLVHLVVDSTALLLHYMTPAFGRMVAEQQRLEGDYRYVHARLIEYSEEIALYHGQAVELRILSSAYRRLVRHINGILHKKVPHVMLEDFIIKYVWSIAGVLSCALPVFTSVKSGENYTSLSERTRNLVKNRRLLISTSDSYGRFMHSYKQIAELAGYTGRVCEMLQVFKDIREGHAMKSQLSDKEGKQLQIEAPDRTPPQLVIDRDVIDVKHVPLVTPAGEVLVKDCNFSIHRGDHLLVVGPNGCGKSSLFRVVGGLWPLISGELRRPDESDIFYLPQKSYMPQGTLRDQVIYPDTAFEMRRKGVSDSFLVNIFTMLHMEHVMARGWDAVEEWGEVLSGGDKQKIAMMRLYYHKPSFAMLDECTSAVSMDMEKIMYEHAIELGITLMTISHRPTLWKYHKKILQFNGEGGVVFGPLDWEKRLALQDEKQKLELALAEAPKIQARLTELERLVAEARGVEVVATMKV